MPGPLSPLIRAAQAKPVAGAVQNRQASSASVPCSGAAALSASGPPRSLPAWSHLRRAGQCPISQAASPPQGLRRSRRPCQHPRQPCHPHPARQPVRQPDARAGPDLARRPLAVWLAPKDGVLNVWVAPIDDIGEARVITDDRSVASASTPGAYTGRHLLYMQDEGGTEDWHIYAVRRSTVARARSHPFCRGQRAHRAAEPRSPRGVGGGHQRPRQGLARSLPRRHQHR